RGRPDRPGGRGPVDGPAGHGPHARRRFRPGETVRRAPRRLDRGQGRRRRTGVADPMTTPLTDRRDFLRRSSALLLGAAEWARADAGKEPVRVAVVGSGARGSDLIRSLSTIEGARIVAV